MAEARPLTTGIPSPIWTVWEAVATSWCDFGAYDVDFGAGRPLWCGFTAGAAASFLPVFVLQDGPEPGSILVAPAGLSTRMLRALRASPVLQPYLGAAPVLKLS